MFKLFFQIVRIVQGVFLLFADQNDVVLFIDCKCCEERITGFFCFVQPLFEVLEEIEGVQHGVGEAKQLKVEKVIGGGLIFRVIPHSELNRSGPVNQTMDETCKRTHSRDRPIAARRPFARVEAHPYRDEVEKTEEQSAHRLLKSAQI